MNEKHWKHPQFGTVFGGTFATPEGRFSWPNLVTPKDAPAPQEGQAPGAPRYEITLLIPKADKKAEEFIKAVTADTDEAIKLFNKGRSATIGNCLLFGKYGDGDTYDHEKYPYYKGCWVLTARNANRIEDKDVMDAGRQPLDRSLIKGGMKGRLVVQTIISGHGISYKMQCVQLKGDDGIRFGGATRDHGDLLGDLEDETVEGVETEQAASAVGEPSATLEKAAVETAAVPPKPKANKGKEAAVNLLA